MLPYTLHEEVSKHTLFSTNLAKLYLLLSFTAPAQHVCRVCFTLGVVHAGVDSGCVQSYIDSHSSAAKVCRSMPHHAQDMQ